MRPLRVIGCVLTLIVSAMLYAPRSLAADPQPYSVELATTGIDALDDTLSATSQLRALRQSAPVNPYGLIARARSDRDRLKTVLDSFGYYDGAVSITIDGRALDDPRLGPELTRRKSGAEAHVRITFKLGPLYRVGRIRIEGHIPPGLLAQLALTPGEPAVAARVLAAGEHLQTLLQDHGYAFAKVARPVAYLDPQHHVLNLTFPVTAGPLAKIGPIRFAGLVHTRQSFLRRRIRLHAGEPYDAVAVERARRRLLDLGLFSSVSVKLGSTVDAEGRVPITFEMHERKRHTVSISAAYSSDLGGSGGITWNDRNLRGRADELDLSATMINLGGTASNGLGYNTSAKYILPDIWQRNETLQFALSGLKQVLQAYTQQSETAGATLSKRLSSVWSMSAGLSLLQESVVQQSKGHDYTLAAVPMSLIYDSTDLPSPLADPTHGTRGALNITPTHSLSLSAGGHPTFTIVQATLAHYFDCSSIIGEKPGRTVLALRLMAGVAFGASTFSLPPDQRFYAGGSGTVRGYRYQSVGPQFADHTPVGGTAMDAINVELRQRIAGHFGAVLFADGGGVSEGHNPFAATRSCTAPTKPATANAPLPSSTSVFCIGVGAGLRYYTPIGPIRLDVALPTQRRPSDDRFEVYVGLGQAF